ncbi:MAG: acyl-[Lachnospiraceae bacterium]|nr:acyl-[acyl-carrier-protein] thioesterase [Lachnospiraceae bacterium]
MYSFRSRVRFSECDTDGKLAFTALLNYFQDCSTQQSEDLGIGVKALHERGTMWVVNSWQIDILRRPKLGDEVETGTLPYDIRGFFGKRNFFMKDADGEFLAVADSLWTYISTDTNSPERIPDDILEKYEPEERLDMEYQGRKIHYPKNGEGAIKGEAVPVTPFLLDANHHVNNGRYVELAAGFLQDGLNPERIRVEYRKQAFLGEVIYPEKYEMGNMTVVRLLGGDGNPYSVVEFSQDSRKGQV